MTRNTPSINIKPLRYVTLLLHLCLVIIIKTSILTYAVYMYMQKDIYKNVGKRLEELEKRRVTKVNHIIHVFLHFVLMLCNTIIVALGD